MPAKQKRPRPLSDRTLINWMQRQLKQPGSHQMFTFSDARDMGYTKDFLGFWRRNRGDPHEAKGNSIRDVLSRVIRAERSAANK